MPFANFKVPSGTLNAEQKETIIHRTTDLYAEIYGERARGSTMVLVEEVTDGGWGIGDQVLTLAILGGPPDSAGTSSTSNGSAGS
jgi:4-oxalocrotonate tautomerase